MSQIFDLTRSRSEIGLIFLRPNARRHAPILIGIHLVLNGDCPDRYAFGFVGLNELHKVIRVGGHVLPMHVAAQHGAVGLHPPRRAPRRRKQKQIGIRLSRFPQNREHVGAVLLDRKAAQAGIDFALVITEDLCRIVAGADAGAANAETHPGRVKQLMKKLLSRRWIQPVEGIAGRVGKRRAKPENWLALLLWTKGNGTTRRTRRPWPPGDGPSLRATLMVVRDPHGYFAASILGATRKRPKFNAARQHSGSQTRYLQKIATRGFV